MLTTWHCEKHKRHPAFPAQRTRSAGSLPADEFKKHHIEYSPSEKPKFRLYLDLLPAHNSGRVCDFTGLGIWLSAFFIFTDTYLGIGDKFAYLLLIAWLTRVLAAPVWLRLFLLFGKHRVWAVSAFTSALITPMALLVAPGPSAFLPLMVYAFALGFVESGGAFAPKAIFGDVVDYDTLKTGSNKAGSYYAIEGLMQKAAIAVGGSVGFYLLSAFEFNVKGGNSAEQNFGLFLAFGIAPPILRAIAGLTIWGFPIDSRRQGIIKRRIESRVH